MKKNKTTQPEQQTPKNVDHRGLIFLDPRHFQIRVMRNGQLMIKLSRGTALVLSEAYISKCFENSRRAKESA